MTAYPRAKNTWTPTPYRCLDFPNVYQLIIDSVKVMAGLQPNPERKYPIPTIFGESAKHIAITPRVHIPHDILTAILRPQLSAI